MPILFRLDDGQETSPVRPAIITFEQLGSFRDLLLSTSNRLGEQLVLFENRRPGVPGYGIEARVCPIALAVASRCFDDDERVIAVLEDAQFRGRRVRVWADGPGTDITIEVSESPDKAPAITMDTEAAQQILAGLGIEPDRAGSVPQTELKSRLSDPVVIRRFQAAPHLFKYVTALNEMAEVHAISGELTLAWE